MAEASSLGGIPQSVAIFKDIRGFTSRPEREKGGWDLAQLEISVDETKASLYNPTFSQRVLTT